MILSKLNCDYLHSNANEVTYLLSIRVNGSFLFTVQQLGIRIKHTIKQHTKFHINYIQDHVRNTSEWLLAAKFYIPVELSSMCYYVKLNKTTKSAMKLSSIMCQH